jgi:hypothetical protein
MNNSRISRRGFLWSTSLAVGAAFAEQRTPIANASASSSGSELDGSLRRVPIQTPEVVEFQLREYLMNKVPALPIAKTASDWSAQQDELRKDLLQNVILRGWPQKWIAAEPNFQHLGTIPSGKGYRIQKFHYEIIPGFKATALLYEPEMVAGRIPAILNLNPHGDQGKQARYKQIMCMNQAMQGIYALSLEWMGTGEMNSPENNHWNGCYLNLIGASAIGLFYLAVRKALDYLYVHPNIDRSRIGATGLSGGAWQTIMITALDRRIAGAVPASGYFSFTSAIERNSDVGDMEYHPHDLFVKGDYPTLTAMVAPRPLMLVYGANDEYGMRAPLQKPTLYDQVKPFFDLYDRGENFTFYESTNPGTHTFERECREQSYAFFARHFGIPGLKHEINVDSQLKTKAELTVGLPSNNLSVFTVAKTLAAEIQYDPIPATAATKLDWRNRSTKLLSSVLRYHPVTVKHAWATYSTRNSRVEALAYRLQFENDLSATAVWLKPTGSPNDAQLQLVLDDDGMRSIPLDMLSYKAASFSGVADLPENSVPWHLSQGRQVLAINLLFTGDSAPEPADGNVEVPALYQYLLSKPDQVANVRDYWLVTRPLSALYGLLLSAAGDRPLGMRVAQLIGAVRWAQHQIKPNSISCETIGIRSQVTTLCAAALEPTLMARISARKAMQSFQYTFENAIPYQQAPELFCLDLGRYFDIRDLMAMAKPAEITIL